MEKEKKSMILLKVEMSNFHIINLPLWALIQNLEAVYKIYPIRIKNRNKPVNLNKIEPTQ